MTTDFSSLLSIKADTIEKPKPLPPGTYDCIIKGYKLEESKQKQTPFCEVALQLVAAGPDVDAEALAAVANWNEVNMRMTYWLSEKTMYRFKELFSDVLGMDISGKTFDELLPQLQGQNVKAIVSNKVSQDGMTVYANVERLIGA